MCGGTHVNPYGRFELDMNSVDLDLSIRAAVPVPRTPQGEAAGTTAPGLTEAAVPAQPGSVTSPTS